VTGQALKASRAAWLLAESLEDAFAIEQDYPSDAEQRRIDAADARISEAWEVSAKAWNAALRGALKVSQTAAAAAQAAAACCAAVGVTNYCRLPAKGRSQLLRCIVGNPFRPAAARPGWRTVTVLGLARDIYEERAFERLPILADALLDCGCEDEAVLSHCRAGGPHGRGCFVIDLLLELA
jgi:hypothetical protein